MSDAALPLMAIPIWDARCRTVCSAPIDSLHGSVGGRGGQLALFQPAVSKSQTYRRRKSLADRRVSAGEARIGQHELPQLHVSRPQRSPAGPQVVGPHAIETLIEQPFVAGPQV